MKRGLGLRSEEGPRAWGEDGAVRGRRRQVWCEPEAGPKAGLEVGPGALLG